MYVPFVVHTTNIYIVGGEERKAKCTPWLERQTNHWAKEGKKNGLAPNDCFYKMEAAEPITVQCPLSLNESSARTRQSENGC